MAIGPVTWQECHQQALTSLYSAQDDCDQLRSQLEASQAECAAVRVCFAEASHNAGPAFVAHKRLAFLEAECERLRKDKARVDWMENELSKGEVGMLVYIANRMRDYPSIRGIVDDAMQPAGGQ